MAEPIPRPSDMDDEANIFAAYLLMPAALFLPAIQGVDMLDDEQVAKVARKFRVPAGAVHFRAGLHRQYGE